MNHRTNIMRRVISLAGAATLASFLLAASPTRPTVSLTQISSDPFTIGPGQHATEVEPHAFANGSTIVAAFQVGRIAPGGATDIGWASSLDGGATWMHGTLPNLTTGGGGGPYDAASDPAVAYDPAHGVWMINSLPISNTKQTPAVVVSRSTDGGLTWGTPVSIDSTATSSDKNWIACDGTPSSPFYGNCYVEWDNPAAGDEIQMSTSTDGGLTWGPAVATQNRATGIGGQPLVQPNGTVVVPIEGNGMQAFSSTNGGINWSKPISIAGIKSHFDAGGIRSGPLPSAAVDGAGTIYVVWEDCSFRTSCSTNDLVYSTSTNGTTWTAKTRVPIDPTTSTVDHFLPGVGIDPTTSGSTGHIAIHYYFYPNAKCTKATCQLFVGFISSANSGTTWNAPITLAGPAQLSWLPNSQNGLMVGDYFATVFNGGVPHGVFAVAQAKSGKTYNEAMNTAQGLTAASRGPQLSSAGDREIPGVKGDVFEHEKPEKGIPPRHSARRASR